MDTFEQKFATFLDLVKKSDQKDLWTDQFAENVKQALIAAHFDQVNIITTGKKKRINGYNLFLKERMLQLKETDLDSNTRMTQISGEWKLMEQGVKDTWKEKAKNVASVEPVKLQIKLKKSGLAKLKVKRSVKWSGYQLFVSENMEKLKDTTQPKERMTEIGKLWKQQTEEQKADYKAKAAVKTAELHNAVPIEETGSAPSVVVVPSQKTA